VGGAGIWVLVTCWHILHTIGWPRPKGVYAGTPGSFSELLGVFFLAHFIISLSQRTTCL
jgi:hypothetical protein